MSDKVYDKVVSIICDQLDIKPEAVSPDTDLKGTLKADSLDIVEIIMELESNFDIEIGDQEIPDVVTVNDIVAYVENNK